MRIPKQVCIWKVCKDTLNLMAGAHARVFGIPVETLAISKQLFVTFAICAFRLAMLELERCRADLGGSILGSAG